ncbi:MAG: CBS domain-containing protein [Candidatus Nezhaarchaeota archaeon]|nr:CBS domain-containing protein [Candidatus Nezhaarchaeota archaeon]MCX8142013.1 CBS domain-containing protein [Candidatus Nezhaarchaeota archaeon]MDW8050206.1 CBS domain-containing protein [Nitrososphaerota archaeon]
MSLKVRVRRLEPRFLRSNGTPNFSSRVYEKHGDVKVIARRPVITAAPTMPIIDALKVMASRGFRRLPVTSTSSRLLGIVTAMDFMDYFGGGSKFNIIVNRHRYRLYAAFNEPLESIMTRDVVKAYLDETFIDVLAKMVKYNVGAIPVVTWDDRIYGIITEKDVVDHLADKITGKRIRDVMSCDVVTVESSSTFKDALKTMVSNGFRRLPVIEGEEVRGMLVAMDVVRFLAGEVFEHVRSEDVRDVLKVKVEEIMVKDVVTVDPDSDIGDAASLMRKHGRGSLLVVENSKLVGIITERDLLMAVVLE